MQNNLLRTILMVIVLGVSSVDAAQSPQALKAEFIETLVNDHDFNEQFVRETLSSATKNPKVLDAIARPWEAKPWHQYYPIFLTEKRLNKGLAFWQQNKEALELAQKTTGVSAQIIVAIIGVETFYGSYLGKYSVLDSLYTLGFYYPPRAKFFRSELAQLFLLSREEGFNIADLKGSYAGAMGWGQFISSSYRHYAIDFDNDGIRDLLTNPTDAIGSVANYFKKHGWQQDRPVAFRATIADGANINEWVNKGLKFKHTWQQLKTSGVNLVPRIALSDQQSVKLIKLQQPQSNEYWVALPNFYSITRYNHSPLYAMAVYQFSEQLRQHMEM